ncbi:MAG: cbb3-type cytochrome c oxidase subunit II, partial [Gemmatimonadota bacterium]
GPDLINVGIRLPDPQWHLIHLYNPRAVVEWSIMPSFPYLFEEKDSAEVDDDDLVVPVREPYAPDDGRVVVATADAVALVDYLLSLQRSYPVPTAEGAVGQPPPAADGGQDAPGGDGGGEDPSPDASP